MLQIENAKKGAAQKPQPQNEVRTRRFQIEELEERIAPLVKLLDKATPL